MTMNEDSNSIYPVVEKSHALRRGNEPRTLCRLEMDEKWDKSNGLPEEGYGIDSSSSGDGHFKEKSKSKKCRKCMKDNIFLFLLIAGIGAGVGLGLGLRYLHPEFREDKRNRMYLEFPGKLLIRMLKMCIIPLVFSSLVAGMASLPSKAAGRLGGYAIAFYMITTFMAVLLGLLLVATIEPGKRGGGQPEEVIGTIVQPVDALLDLVRNLFPDNIIAATMSQARTKYEEEERTVLMNRTNITSGIEYQENVTEMVITDFSVGKDGGTNILGIVLFSIMLGLIIGRMGEKAAVLFTVFDSFQLAIIRIIKIFIWYTPIGVCFLLASKLVSMEDIDAEFKSLAWYIMTVLVGLFIHAIIVLPVIYVIFTRKNPFKLLVNMSRALLTAFGTASSSATMPLTLNCLEEKAHVDSRISRFMIPVGATINMDGTALYEAVASVYIAQTLGHELDAGKYVTVSLTATAAAIGAAGVPEAGLVTMLIVLTAIGLPATDETLALIYAVDWFLDRCRTMINVWGDSIGAGVVEVLSKKQLRKMDEAGITISGHINSAYVTGQPEKGGPFTRL